MKSFNPAHKHLWEGNVSRICDRGTFRQETDGDCEGEDEDIAAVDKFINPPVNGCQSLIDSVL